MMRKWSKFKRLLGSK